MSSPTNTIGSSAQALHGNPYDGHTLSGALAQAERIIGAPIQHAVCDQGYRGRNFEGSTLVHLVRYVEKKAKSAFDKMLRRRPAIETSIGHMKFDHRLDRNYLLYQVGDRNNAVLAAAGFNFRKLLRAFLHALNEWIMATLAFAHIVMKVFGKNDLPHSSPTPCLST